MTCYDQPEYNRDDFSRVMNNIPVIRFLKEPIRNIEDLYIKYPQGGEYGWFAMVNPIGGTAYNVYWDIDDKEWKPVAVDSTGIEDKIRPILDTDFFANSQRRTSSVGQPIKVGDTWTNIISSQTGESQNYKVVDKYFDGSVMDDTKVDGVIYRKRGNEYLRQALDLTKTRSLIFSDISELKAIDKTNTILLQIGYYVDVQIVGSDYIGVFELEKPIAKQPFITSDNGSVFSYKDNGSILVDVFGVKRDDITCIDSNARLIEELIEFAMPLQFLRGEYFIRRIDLTKPQYSISTYLGVYNRDFYPDRAIWTILNTDGESLFVRDTNSRTNTPIDFRYFYVKSKSYSGEFYETKDVRESGMSILNCILQGFDKVLVQEMFATGLRFERVRVQSCRYGIIVGKEANLARLTDVSFFETAQCISVYGHSIEISYIQLQGLYTNSDWEELDLFGIRVYNGVIKNVYMEAYRGEHGSQSKFFLMVRRYDYAAGKAHIENFAFPKSGDAARCPHLRVEVGGQPFPQACTAPTEFIRYAPLNVDYGGRDHELMILNMTLDDHAISSDKFTADVDTFINVVNAPLIVKEVGRYNHLVVERKYNIGDKGISPNLGGTVENNKYYNEADNSFYVNQKGKFRVTGLIEIAGLATDVAGKIRLLTQYRDSSSVKYLYLHVKDIEIDAGAGSSTFEFYVNHLGGVPIRLTIENVNKAGYVPITTDLLSKVRLTYDIVKLTKGHSVNS